MASHVNYWGLVVAGIGFFLTRFTVTLAIYQDPVRFYLAGVVPLALGLGLAAFGVALAAADVEAALVRTTARWCVIGLVSMSILVVLTLLGSTTGGFPDVAAIRSRAYLSNFLIGGSVGGTLIGLYAARNREQRRERRRQANRLEVLNRLLRHEVLNAVTTIRGYASLEDDDATEVIRDRSQDIERTIDTVRDLARSGNLNGVSRAPIALDDSLAESVSTVTDRYPDAEISVDPHPGDPSVRADDRLEQVFTTLLDNAAVHSVADSPRIDVSVTATPTEVRVSIDDEGPGLPESQQRLLESGRIEEYDDPETGFGLNVARLLVEDYDGTIETDVGESGTTITVVLPRAGDGRTARKRSGLTGIRPAKPHMGVALVASVIAGFSYGLVSELLGSSIAGIGVFYGTANVVVGWITHEFHSVVFGFAFVSLVSLVPAEDRQGRRPYVAAGIGWGLVLWIVAAGVVAPIWLRLLGIRAPLPSLSLTLLASHLAWGSTLGVLVALGDEYVLGDEP